MALGVFDRAQPAPETQLLVLVLMKERGEVQPVGPNPWKLTAVQQA